jgi:hypothetical protein
MSPAGESEACEPGLLLLPSDSPVADVVTLQRRAAATIRDGDEEGFFQDTIAEYVWARDVAGLSFPPLHGHRR